MRLLTRATLVLALVGVGCTRRPSSENPASAAAPRGSSNILTQQQLNATNAPSVYDAIQKLRPEWLTSRGATSVTDETLTVASVYMNGNNIGKINALKDIRVLDISQARYWDAGSASARFGMGHPRGVIELTR